MRNLGWIWRPHELEHVGLLHLSPLLENVTSQHTYWELPEILLVVKDVRKKDRENNAAHSFFCHTATAKPNLHNLQGKNHSYRQKLSEKSELWRPWPITVKAQTALGVEPTPLMAEQLRTQMEGQTTTHFLWEYTWQSQSTQRLSVYYWQILGELSMLCLIQSFKDFPFNTWEPPSGLHAETQHQNSLTVKSISRGRWCPAFHSGFWLVAFSETCLTCCLCTVHCAETTLTVFSLQK